ncbi:probable RNA-dependent RNA polymerase 1 [Fagus crenata]
MNQKVADRAVQKYARQIPTPVAISLSDGLALVPRVQITPSKVYFCGPECIICKWGERTSIYDRILSTLNGIVIGELTLLQQDIREWMGDFHQIGNVAKYAARLGLSFGSSEKL